MDTFPDQFPLTDPGLGSEDFNMVENHELDCKSFSSCVKYGPAWTSSGHPVVERERAATLVVSVHCFTLDGGQVVRGSWSAPVPSAANGGICDARCQEAALKALRSDAK